MTPAGQNSAAGISTQASQADGPACRLAVLLSGQGSTLQAIIDAIAQKRLHAQISAVISNRPQAYGLQRAAQAGLPCHMIDHTQFASRDAFDQALQQRLEQYDVDLVVLAGFMRILTPQLVAAYAGRMLNIHPSLLPRYPGLNTHQRALDAHDSEQGTTVHFVTQALDGGPIIAQARLSIHTDDTVQTLQQRVQQLEHQLYPQVIQWFAQGRLTLQADQAYLDGQPCV